MTDDVCLSGYAECMVRSKITACLPVKDNYKLTVLTLDRLLKLDVNEILISVNSPGSQSRIFLELQRLDARIRVFLQENNLGLYGNFRFLAQQAKCEYFFWNCVDDYIPSSFLAAFFDLDEHTRAKYQLFAPPVQRIPFDYSSGEWIHPKTDGMLNSEFTLTLNDQRDMFNFNPSFIFGIWKKSAFLGLVPSTDFDWLDTLLLTKLYMRGGIYTLNSQTPVSIGTRTPRSTNHVNGKYHNPIPWIAAAGLEFLTNLCRIPPQVLLKSYLKGIRDRILFSLYSYLTWIRSQSCN